MQPLLTVRDVAAVLNVSRSRAYELVNEGKLDPVIRLGKRSLRLRPEAVEKYVDSLAERP